MEVKRFDFRLFPAALYSFYTTAKDKAATAANLPIIRIHDFRHSHASLLINNNINILEVAHRLGHASTTQTLQVYAHLFPNDENKVVKLLDSFNFLPCLCYIYAICLLYFYYVFAVLFAVFFLNFNFLSYTI